jgi:hypothetical protein
VDGQSVGHGACSRKGLEWDGGTLTPVRGDANLGATARCTGGGPGRGFMAKLARNAL